MKEDTQQEVKHYFEKLPSFLREIIASNEFQDKIETIAHTHHLTDSQREAFHNEVLLLLLGVADPEEYPENIQNIKGLPEESAQSIVKESSDEILIPIKELFDQHEKENAQSETENKTPPPTPPQKPHSNSNSEGGTKEEGVNHYEEGDPYREPAA